MRPSFHGKQEEIIKVISDLNEVSPHTAIMAICLMLNKLKAGVIPQEFINEVYKHQPYKDKRSK